ncbi:TolC family protein [Halarcobacter anaerophilus]|uniref:Transporter n=1 Tax=Halarcobacter anaerophilus TaxID=877500 RepID=A0A4Q0Y6R3_9BACT|nr:TolC family protein [Halarcobacter anaerophilus]QDF27830.1 RND family efflux system, outer membrane channel protein, TolC family [Halarcobacter anaerophilus]RXJ64171.1 transporter [Halarcobacter anaerophilus]
MKKVFIFLLIVPFSLFGENLAQLIELSKNNKMIDSSRINIESTKEEYKSVQNSYLPEVKLGANYQRTNKETSSVPDNRTTVQGSVDYVIYDGGKKYDTFDSYEATIKSQNNSLQNQKNELALEVTNYYYEYLSLEAQKEAKIKEIEQLRAQYNRLKRFLDAGTTTEDEVQKIISRGESANVDLHEIELDIQTIIHNLEYVVGKSVTIQKGSIVEEYTSNEKKLRADIKALEFELESLLATAKGVKSGYLPDLTFNDTYAKNDLNYKKGAFDGNSDDYDQNIASLNMSWKIFDFGATSREYQAAYKKYLSLRSQYEYEKNKADVDLKLALKAYKIGKLKIKSAQAGLKAANSAYDVIKSKYQNGLVDNVAYLEALSEKYDAQSVLKMAQYDLEVKKANIIYYSGEKLEEFVK